MTENENKSLIGFDPLAWMNEEDEDADKSDAVVKDENIANEEEDDDFDYEVQPEPVIDESTTDKNIKIDEESKITLNATLNIQSINHLYEQLLASLDKQDKIEIDASAVESVDTATLQLLIVLKQAAMKLQKEVSIDFPSDAFIDAAALLGVSEMLDVDQAAAGLF